MITPHIKQISERLDVKLRLAIGAIGCLAFAQPGMADEIYKTINSDGTVSYSNVAPDSAGNAEVIEEFPEPSEADQQAAQQRLREIQANLEQRRVERAEAAAEAEESATESADGATAEESDEDAVNPPPLNNGFIGVAPFI